LVSSSSRCQFHPERHPRLAKECRTQPLNFHR
jgi:hypothetical protein